MKKKSLVWLTAVSLSAVLLAGCGGNAGGAGVGGAETSASAISGEVTQLGTDGSEAAMEEPLEGDPTVLRMAWWGSQTRHDLTVQVIEMYEKENPHIDIEYEFYSFDDYFTKLKTLVASDQVWDIFQLGGNFPMYMDKIHFLNDAIEAGIVDISDIPESYLQITRDIEGNQIGLFNGLNTYGIAYDVWRRASDA